MTFYGKTSEADAPRKLRKFAYRTYPGATEQDIQSHEIYFYEAGRIGFWNYIAEDERVLVLATKAFDVREVIAE
jgi:hypothetical protein